MKDQFSLLRKPYRFMFGLDMNYETQCVQSNDQEI